MEIKSSIRHSFIRRIQTVVTLLSCLLITSFAWSQPQFQAAVSKSTVSVGEKFKIEFSVNAGGGQFDPPTFNGFRILSGPNQATSMQFVNGRSAYSLTYSYILMALEEGAFEIEPAKIKVGNDVITSNKLNINVVKDGSNSGSSAGSNSNQQSQSRDAEIDQNLFIMAHVSKTNPFQGEQFVATYRLYFNYNIAEIAMSAVPSLNGFWAEDLEIPNKRPSIETYNGVRYNVVDLKKTILIPQRSGALSVDPLEMDLVIQQQVQSRGRSLYDQFFGSYRNVQVQLKSKPLTINVRPLPSGKPANFNGAVGQFEMSFKADRTDVKSNEAINVSYTITGAGNLKLLEEPKINFPSDFEVYDAKVDDQITANGNGISGTRSYNYLTIPRYKGNFLIEPVTFVYFDPKKEKYITQTAGPIDFNIEKGSGEANPQVTFNGANKEEVKLLGSDIRFIKLQTTLINIGHSFFGTARFFLLWLFPFPLFFLIMWLKKRMDAKRGDVVYMKKSRANKMAVKRLSEAKKHMVQKEEKPFYEEVFKAMYGFFEHKFTIAASDISKDRIKDVLIERGLDNDLIARTMSILDNCEMARFAPSSSITMEQTYNESVSVLSEIQKQLK